MIDASSRFTVPVLWDIETSTIVNNESSEIIRMLNTEFDDLLPADAAGRKLDLYPQPLRGGIDSMNEWIYDSVNSASFFISSFDFACETDLVI